MASRRAGVGSPCRATRPGQQAGDEVPPCRAAGGLGAGQDAGHSRAGGSSAPAPADSPRLPLNPLGPCPRHSSPLPQGAARFPAALPVRAEAEAEAGDGPGDPRHRSDSKCGRSPRRCCSFGCRGAPGSASTKQPVANAGTEVLTLSPGSTLDLTSVWEEGKSWITFAFRSSFLLDAKKHVFYTYTNIYILPSVVLLPTE